MRDLAASGADIVFKPFKCARGRIVAQHHGARREHVFQRFQHWREQIFHAGGGDLHHAHIIETIDRQPRQPITFGMDQAVKRLAVERIAQDTGARKMFREKRLADGRIALRFEQAHADQALGIEIACP